MPGILENRQIRLNGWAPGKLVQVYTGVSEIRIGLQSEEKLHRFMKGNFMHTENGLSLINHMENTKNTDKPSTLAASLYTSIISEVYTCLATTGVG